MDINLTKDKIRLKKRIYESSKTIVYKGVKGENIPIIIKLYKGKYPNSEDISIYENEYFLLKKLTKVDGVIKPFGFIREKNMLGIIFEEFKGDTLLNIIDKNGLTILESLNISLKILDIIEKIHNYTVIHKDINPSNILLSGDKNRVQLIDFGISVMLPWETPQLMDVNIEGNLQYISPEQTGRINKNLDYRSDFYSFGVTLYKMLTNILPFRYKNPLELIHAHIAKEPLPPNKINTSIPEVLSSIVLKLIEKKAENRYQSVMGIREDLKKCYDELRKYGTIPLFEIAKNDYIDKFKIPDKIYERDNEIEVLVDLFKKSSVGTMEVAVIYGVSGSGVKSLVKEINHKIILTKFKYIDGDFDKYKEKVPYHGFIEAFKKLIKQILMEDEKQLNIFKTVLKNSFEDNINFLLNTFPELKSIISPTISLTVTTTETISSRFKIIMQEMIKVFATPKKPIILFLDNLQWADNESLKLIESLIITSNLKNIFLILGYRSDKGGNLYFLKDFLKNISQKVPKNNTLKLGNLSIKSIKNMISKLLEKKEDKILELAEIVFNKTAGNPFFLKQFLYKLNNDGLISFDYNIKKWVWNIDKIIEQKISENVLDILSKKIEIISIETLNILEIASIIGDVFDIMLLVSIYQYSFEKTRNDLFEALQLNLITYNSSKNIYRFSDSKIRNIIYKNIPKGRKEKLHLKTAKIMLDYYSGNQREIYIFDILKHFNNSKKLITTEKDRVFLIEMNLWGAEKSKETAAFNISKQYIDIAESFISDHYWNKYYNLLKKLYFEKIEISYYIGDYNQVNRSIEIIKKYINSDIDNLKLYNLVIQADISMNRYESAIDTSIKVLRKFSIKISKDISDISFLIKFMKVKYSLKKNETRILSLPLLKDEIYLNIISLMSKMCSISYFNNSKVMGNYVLEMIKISLKYGNSEFSAFSYLGYGVISLQIFDDIDIAFKYGLIAKKLLTLYENKNQKIKIEFTFQSIIKHWKRPLKECLKKLKDTFYKAIKIGDIEYASYSGAIYSHYLFFTGYELNKVIKELKKIYHYSKKLNSPLLLYWIGQDIATIIYLESKPIKYDSLDNKYFNEKNALKIFKADNNSSSLLNIYFRKFLIYFIYDSFNEAKVEIDQMALYIDKPINTYIKPLSIFYYSIFYTYYFDKFENIPIKKIKRYIKKMEKWAKSSPNNYKHKYHLMKAEVLKIEKKYYLAEIEYDIALKTSLKSDIFFEIALAYELAGEFFISRERENFGYYLIEKSFDYYYRWGATGKLKYFEKKYPDIFIEKEITEVTNRNNIDRRLISSHKNREELDMISVIKSSQAISEEIVFDKLLNNFLKIMVENAGAQKGVLILNEKNTLFVEIEYITEPENMISLYSIPIKDYEEIPHSIIQYIKRTKEYVVLDEAYKEGIFINDEYIQKYSINSILSMPIIYRDQLKGVIYLENNLTASSFDPERVKVLNLLSSQIAISVENASLYKNLQKDIEARNKAEKEVEKYQKHLEQLVETRTDELTRSETHFRELVNYAKSIILKIDGMGFISFINPYGLNFLGYEESELLNRSIFKTILPNLDIDKFLSNNGYYQKTKYEEIKVLRKNGKAAWVIWSNRPVFNIDGNIVQILSIGTDVTELKYTKEALKKAKDEAENANQAKSRFLASMSHEIRTPMNAILGFSELLEKKIVNKVERDYLMAIKQSGKTLLRLINDILDLSKIEAGKLELQYTKTDLYLMLEDMKTIFSQEVNKKGLSFLIDISKKVPQYINIDEVRLRQIFLNIIGNGIKFTKEGGIFINIEGKNFENTQFQLKISIRDTGIGIPEDQLDEIFEEFRQKKGQVHAQFGGTGLGLSITKKLIEMMGGKILVESEVDKGSNFVFTINNIEFFDINKKNDSETKKQNISISIENDKKNKENIEKKLVYGIENVFDKELLLKDIDEILYKEWNVLKGSYIFSNIEKFSNLVIDIGNKHSYNALKIWGRDLLNYTKNFDMANIEIYIKEFPKIKEFIESYK